MDETKERRKTDNKVTSEKTTSPAHKEKKGFSLYVANYILAGLALVISISLLVVANLATNYYTELTDFTKSYLNWSNAAVDLKNGSDYLTEQVRGFVFTGEKEYLDNYFYEAIITDRRSKALKVLREELNGTDAQMAMEEAMKVSMELMDREFYAMRLAAEANGYNIEKYPDKVREIQLTEADQLLAPEEMMEKAEGLVFGNDYRRSKDLISEWLLRCQHDLEERNRTRQSFATAQMRNYLALERALIIGLEVIILGIVLMTSFFLMIPLRRRIIAGIRAKRFIPVRGSQEIRFLANAYNEMLENTRQKEKKLAYAAAHDPLTGLFNRSEYDYLCRETDLQASALLLIDIDKFKMLNDTYGHAVGDAVLKKAARIFRENFRSGDAVCRIGGDEFAVIMMNAGTEHRDLIEEKLNCVREAMRRASDGVPGATISVGVAFGEFGEASDKIFKKADTALYRVKNGGRDGIAFYE